MAKKVVTGKKKTVITGKKAKTTKVVTGSKGGSMEVEIG